MARVRITVYTTLFGEVSVDAAFDEEFVEDRAIADVYPTITLTSVAAAVQRASDTIIAAHSRGVRSIA